MFKKYKQFLIGILVGGVLFGAVPVLAKGQAIEAFFYNIKIKINNKLIPTDVEPFIYAGRTYVPVRFVAEAFNKEVKWNETTNTVEINDMSNNNQSIYTPPPTQYPKAESSYRKDGLDIYVYDKVEYVTIASIENKYPFYGFGYIRDNNTFELARFKDKFRGERDIIFTGIPAHVLGGGSCIQYDYFISTILPLLK